MSGIPFWTYTAEMYRTVPSGDMWQWQAFYLEFSGEI